MKIRTRKISPRRLTLKSWAAMEDVKQKIDKESKEGHWSAIPELIIQVIKLATEDKRDFRNLFWLDVSQTYTASIVANLPIKDPPLLTSKEKQKTMPWEYEGRTWYFWLNLFAKHYGWGEKQIEVMDIDSAIALYQEILVDQQLEQEFHYSLSEIAYPYSKSTKTSKYQPMPRPDWMRMVAPPKNQPVKTTQMPKTVFPVGNVINLDES